MTATAYRFDTLHDLNADFDTDVDTAFDGDFAPARPQLRLVPGEGRAIAPVPAVDPMVEVYRRRRFALALALTFVILAVTQVAGISLTSFGPTTTTTDESAPLVHVVRPGDSYAVIAAELGFEDPNAMASVIEQANGGADLVTGQRLVLDVGDLAAGS